MLLLVGIASLLLVNARAISDYFKENMQVSVMMKQSVTESDALRYKDELDKADLNNMTPLQAFDLLRSMKEQLGI